jgi:hypothetical protein
MDLPEGRARVQDRLVLELPKPSKGKQWTRRIEARNDAAASGGGTSTLFLAGAPQERLLQC